MKISFKQKNQAQNELWMNCKNHLEKKFDPKSKKQ